MEILDRYIQLTYSHPVCEIDQLILDGFEYEIFEAFPSVEHVKWFKEAFDVPYPVEISELTENLIKDIKQAIEYRKEEQQHERKMELQRKEKCYCDEDVWNLNDWFMTTVPKLLREFREHLTGYPPELTMEEWEVVIDRMLFLLSEMNEETCSHKNKYEEAVDKAKKEFSDKYGILGRDFEKLQGIEHNSDYGIRLYTFADDPDKPENAKLLSDWINEDINIFNYRNKCKDEFFELFSKYFWNLWD